MTHICQFILITILLTASSLAQVSAWYVEFNGIQNEENLLKVHVGTLPYHTCVLVTPKRVQDDSLSFLIWYPSYPPYCQVPFSLRAVPIDSITYIEVHERQPSLGGYIGYVAGFLVGLSFIESFSGEEQTGWTQKHYCGDRSGAG